MRNPIQEQFAKGRRIASKLTFATKCLGCGEKFTKLGSWFYRHKFKCSVCGGELDPEPFRELVRQAIRKLQATLKRKE